MVDTQGQLETALLQDKLQMGCSSAQRIETMTSTHQSTVQLPIEVDGGSGVASVLT